MRRHWWLTSVILVTLLISFRVPSAWTFHMGPTGNEESICLRAEVLMCDNFEGRSTGGGGWATHTYKNNGWATSTTATQTVVTGNANDGTKSLQHFYPAVPRAGDNGGGGYMSSYWLGNAQRTIYARWYVKYSSDYVRSPIAEKHSIVQPSGAADGRNHPLGIVGGSTPVYGREGNFPILLQNFNGVPTSFVNNTWYCVEFRVTANNPGSTSNGYVQGWVNDVQKFEYPNLQMTTANNALYDYIEFSGYWNCSSSNCLNNTHPDMERWIDRVVVSTARIGCTGTPPAAPSQLLIR